MTVSFLKTKLTVFLKPIERLWAMPPLSWIKPPILRYLRKKASKVLDENWTKELKKMDWQKDKKTSEKEDHDSFELWEQLIIQLAQAYEEKEITMEEVASFLKPEQTLADLSQLKINSDHLSDEIKTVMKKIEDQKTEMKQNQQIQMLMQNWVQKAPVDLKTQKMLKEYAEHQKRVFKQMVAQTPEIIENLPSDQFQSQSDQLRTKNKIIQKEETLLRQKMNTKTQSEKTIKQIGAEKQKALDELSKKNKGTTESSI